MKSKIAEQGIAEERTVDAFHRGAFWLVQPARGAHRAGMDAMMLGAAVPEAFAGSIADLGAGAGAAGLAVAARCRKANVLLVERDPAMAAFAREALVLPDNAAIAGRVAVLEADVTLTGRRRTDAGLADGNFDFAVMNPPFNAAPDRASPNAQRKAAHVMEPGMFEAWLRTAAGIVRPGGGVAIIARPQSLPDMLAALKGRFGGVRILPVLPHEDAAAIRVVLRGVRDSRAGLSLEPPLVLHRRGGHASTDRADAIINGRASLFGD